LVSLFVAGGFLAALLWAISNDQFEDEYAPSVRMLFDDKESESNKKQK
jgi:cbb3-type cytochrome oxidase maturation protein